MPQRPFSFESQSGYAVTGRLELPDAPVRGWALFAHCFTCGKDHLAAVRIARSLARSGIGVLCFDFAGLGSGEGAAAPISFASDVRDLVEAGAAMAAAGMAPALLVGHSLGGAAVLAAAGDMPSVKAVATIGAPFEIAHVLEQIDAAGLAAIREQGKAEVSLAGRPFTITRPFVEDLRTRDLGRRIAALDRALLVLHAPRDTVVGIDNATRIFMAARHPKSFVSLDDGDHLLSDRADAEYAASIISAWAARYLPAVPTLREEGQEGDVVAEETGAGRFQVAIRAGGIRFLADEPEEVGGLGSGPTPYDLLCGALAACTTMTVRMYADLKGLPVEAIRTAVGHAKQPGVERPDLFSRRIAIDGDLDAGQRARLLEIADRCPVHRTLSIGARVETRVGEAPAPAEDVSSHARAMEKVAGS